MQSVGLLFKVLWSPGEAMFINSKNPRVLTPALFVSLISLLGAIAIQMKVSFGELYMNMLTKSPQAARMPEESKAQLQRVMSLPAVQGVFIASAVVIPLITILVVTVVYFGLFSMLGREGGFKAYLSTAAFAFVPSIFSVVASVLRAFVVPPAFLMLDELGSLSPAPFLDRDSASPLLFATVNSIDLVSIWSLALLAIGFGFVTRKSLSKATRTVATVGVFLFYTAIKLGFVALQS